MKISAIYGNRLNYNVQTLWFRADLFSHYPADDKCSGWIDYLFQEEACCCHKNDKSWHW